MLDLRSVDAVEADLELGAFMGYHGHGIAIGYVTDNACFGAEGFFGLRQDREQEQEGEKWYNASKEEHRFS
ncbi:MAG TPA: hypothetical protein VKF36_20315 [Syntrophorhabdales bacterium]|nr:hypothetical protein [Syntrophorhabdales bacterium]